MAAKNNSNEIRITRVYDAPVSMVWAAWTEPAQAAHWWGPRGFTITTHHHDLKSGGTWKYTMHGPDGTDYPSTTQYLEVEKNARLVYDHGGNEDQPPLFRVTVNFAENKGKTKMEMTMTLPTPEAAEKTRAFIKTASGDSTWDRFAEYLEKKSSQKELFVINRSFAVPLRRMFEMWTSPAHLAKWLPPTGFELQFLRAEIKPGGSSFYVMSGAGDMKMFGRCDYLEIDAPDRIVYTQQFCDKNEKVIRHPMSALWPETMLTHVQFSAEGEAQTRVTVTWEPHGKITREELDTFIKAKPGMAKGWTGSFDKLETYLTGE